MNRAVDSTVARSKELSLDTERAELPGEPWRRRRARSSACVFDTAVRGQQGANALLI
jgi:hypothetical protein